MIWRPLFEVRQIRFVTLTGEGSRQRKVQFLLMVNKNKQTQKIYCGIKRPELATLKRAQESSSLNLPSQPDLFSVFD